MNNTCVLVISLTTILVDVCFTLQALSKYKNTTVLWTNRAQAYIKLGEFDKALADCDWALRVSGMHAVNCSTVLIHV